MAEHDLGDIGIDVYQVTPSSRSTLKDQSPATTSSTQLGLEKQNKGQYVIVKVPTPLDRELIWSITQAEGNPNVNLMYFREESRPAEGTNPEGQSE